MAITFFAQGSVENECWMNNLRDTFFDSREPAARAFRPISGWLHRTNKTRRKKKGEETMLNRTTILALAAVAAIGAASLASSSALAMGNQGVGNHGLSGKTSGNVNGLKKHPDIGQIGKPKKNPDIGNIHWPHRHHHYRHFWRYYPVIVGGGSVAYATSRTTPAPAGTCNCLTKEYLADGSVLFKDLCTKEMAVKPASSNQAQGQQ
jgi:hypothetical protein